MIRTSGAVLVVLLAAASARADEPQPSALFFRARELMAQGKYAEACPLLEESQRLDPGVGTQFNLARCYELVGRLASAWRLYDEVARATHATGQSAREAIAVERLKALEPRVAHVVVRAPEEVTITLDGAPLEERDAKVDPGTHEVGAAAPGKRPFTTRVAVSAEAERVVVDVPALADDAAALPPEPPPRAPEPPPVRAEEGRGGTQRVVALGALGGAVGALGLGTFFGIRALTLAKDADSHCIAAGCDSDGVSLRRSSLHAGDASTVSFVAAGVLAATGAVLWLTAPARAVSVRVAPRGLALGVGF
jgi:hypothetical protein